MASDVRGVSALAASAAIVLGHTVALPCAGVADAAPRPPPTVRPATPDDMLQAVSTLMRAFDADPFMSWMVRRDELRVTAFAKLFSRVFRASMAHNLALVASSSERDAHTCPAVALWFPPAVEPDVPNSVWIDFAGGWRRAWWTMRVNKRFDAVHPREPHYFLFFVGVEATQKGRGLGGALIRHVLQRADAEGMPCYLENSNPGNTAMYERFGFRVRVHIDVGMGAPPVLGMWREPRPPSSTEAV